MKGSRVILSAAILLVAISGSLVGATAQGTAAQGTAAQDPAASPPVTVDVRGFAAATAPGGRIWMVWSADVGGDTEILYSTWDGTTWSTPRAVHPDPLTWDENPSVVIAADGTPWAAWTASVGEVDRLKLGRWTGKEWSLLDTLPSAGMNKTRQPVLAAAPDGTLWLAWVAHDGVDDEVFASFWDGSRWSAPQQVSADEADPALWDRQPRLAVGRDGRPWLVWTGHQAGVDDEIFASHWTGTAWTSEQMVSRDDDSLDVWPTLALDSRDQPIVAWTADMTDADVSRRRILASRWDAVDQAWTTEALASSPLSVPADEERPALAVGSDGEIDLAWLASTASSTALAHTTWAQDGWTTPGLGRAGVNTYAVALVTGEDRDPWLLWIDPALNPQLPVASAPVEESAQPLSSWAAERSILLETPLVDSIPNRFLAFGDSITWGLYPVDDPVQDPFYPYPSILDDNLDVKVMAADVVNAGEPGEGTGNGKDRIKIEVADHLPKYVLIMEGTNNVSHDALPSEIYGDYLIMIDNARKWAEVKPVKVMLATLIPRLDSRNDETYEMNQEAVIPAAATKDVPVCDQWTAFNSYGPLEPIYWDEKHPNQEGLQLFADTWYGCSVGEGRWLNEETIPPTAWIASLPPESECGEVTVSWTGQDNLSWVVDYDVQMNVNNGLWVDWLMGTQQTSATYASNNFGDQIGFRVRGRDVVGNLGVYSDPAYTVIADSGLPQAHMFGLPPAQTAPIPLAWWGTDDCAPIVGYDVHYKVGLYGTWTVWQTGTSATSGAFTPPSPQYGQTYYFRTRAQDEAGNWSDWSDALEAYTTLARYSVSGQVYNLRHQFVYGPAVTLDPAAVWTSLLSGGFSAYVTSGGDYDITVSRSDRYGLLPARYGVTVGADVGGLEFVLPPQDDAVVDGGFEAGTLDAWRASGTAMPAWTSEAHTGLGAVQMGAQDSTASIAQTLTPGLAVTDPTLSFMVRLSSAGPSALQIELANSGILSPPVTYNLPVESDAWTHVWYDLSGMVSKPLTLTLTVSDSLTILVDEVSLGSARQGGFFTYLPLVGKQW